MNLPFANPQARNQSAQVQDALSSANQRVQPVRQNTESDFYAQMVKKLNDKPSVKEIIQAYSHG
ncbi:hypothetical protein [Pseudomonas fragi]|uniref:hypothetical protein n=1 Tax=Pseudomonas fragi TaxID=296 RepID=UPI00036EDBED|nr:hypothetical protein [Pseudomonas fragi]MDE4514937.1 hypothetical protein [Pseudomonas fragi]QPC36484.1 hypothetical protein IS178_04515 [Pseudomonas fragi]SDU40433.1 hypothetical protein SAMN05216594_2295 [Pseudomonas fragi]